MRTDVMLSLPRADNGRNPFRLDVHGHANNELARLREVAGEFESLLLEHMIKEMRVGGPKSTLLGEDPGREIFNEMLDGEYARLMSRRGGIGIADFMTRGMAANVSSKK